jgi:hypothetical protein
MTDPTNRAGGDPLRQVTSEHRRLEVIFRQTRETFVPPRGHAEAHEAVRRLWEVVDGHLTSEDSLYYPSLWTRRPQIKDALQAFVCAHDDFRVRLTEIAAQVARGALAEALASFDAFVDVFDQHEMGEELLLDRIEREPPRQG